MPATAKKQAKPSRKRPPKIPPAPKKDVIAVVRQIYPTITAREYAEKFHLSFEEQTRLTGFCMEYVKDFNITQAACRLGYPYAQAASAGMIMLTHCFSQLTLSEMVKAMTADMVVSMQQVVARLWEEANAPDVPFSSNASTRITALTALAKIMRFGEPTATKISNTIVTSGVMVVPMAASPDEWGAMARQTQKALKDSTYIDAEIVRP